MTTPIEWDPNLLWNKAVSYANRPTSPHEGEETLFACLALELLGRAVLTAIHPSLNADPQSEGAHIMYACGIPMRAGQPKSIPVHAVFSRLEAAYPDFKPHRAICEYLVNLRNEELHTAAMPFRALSEAKWLADYYAAVVFLCAKLGKKPADYLAEAAEHAELLIKSKNSERRAEVKKRIAALTTIYDGKAEEEKVDAVRKAETATQFRQERTATCPSCQNPALLSGDEIRRSEPVYSEGELDVTVTYATNELKCVACGLHLRTVDDCAVAGVKPRFQQHEATSLHDIHQDQQHEEYDNM